MGTQTPIYINATVETNLIQTLSCVRMEEVVPMDSRKEMASTGLSATHSIVGTVINGIKDRFKF